MKLIQFDRLRDDKHPDCILGHQLFSDPKSVNFMEMLTANPIKIYIIDEPNGETGELSWEVIRILGLVFGLVRKLKMQREFKIYHNVELRKDYLKGFSRDVFDVLCDNREKESRLSFEPGLSFEKYKNIKSINEFLDVQFSVMESMAEDEGNRDIISGLNLKME